MGRVAGKIALVTGGASGIGKADVRLLAAEGATVFLTDVNEAQGRAVEAEISKTIFLKHDVTDEAGWMSVMATVREHFGRLDILVNNAGIVKFGTIEDATLDEFRRVLSVTVEGSFLGCKHAIPLMRETSGSIINMSSIAALKGFPTVNYTAAKGAVRAMTKSVAIHCQNKGYDIRCNVILPGTIDTPMTASAMASVTQSSGDPPGSALTDKVGAMRWGKVEDVAGLVLYLASDESRYVTGAEISIDGGDSIR